MSARNMASDDAMLNGAFPEVHSFFRIETGGDELYHAQFYPFKSPDADPVFASAWGRNTVIFRPLRDAERGVEIVRWFKDDDERALLWSIVWALDLDTGDPLVCVSGDPAQIKILNVRTGKLVRSLVGHGARVNMMALCPIAPNIIASASDDHTVRLWNLSPSFAADPCRVMLAGWGHKAEVLCMAFHQTGRFALSAGNDTRICLWVLPDMSSDKPTDKTRIVHYPHFVSEEIHPRLVDCVEFYGDFILSKCLSPPFGRILLWRIVGFSSDKPAPPASTAPTASVVQRETRSAFCSTETKGNGAFQVLLSFDMPNVLYHGHRFGLYHHPQEHPVLAVGNSSHWISFWDLRLLEQGLLGCASMRLPAGKKTTYATTIKEDASVQKDPFSSPFSQLKPHKTVHLPSSLFPTSNRQTIRSIAWSVGGEWCVAVGDDGLMCLMRWPAKEEQARKAAAAKNE